MAKTIKFNLICDGNPIRTIEDLQENFSIEDVLAYYNNKLLHRWLKVRGYDDKLQAVNEITDTKAIDIIKKLIEIFDIEADETTISQNVYMLDYLEERKELFSIYKADKFKVSSIIDDYQTGYDQLVDVILENSDDIVKIKATLLEIVENYYSIFRLNYKELFYKFYYNAPMAIFVLLTIDKARNYYLPVKIDTKDGTQEYDINCSYNSEEDETIADKTNMYSKTVGLIPTCSEILGDNLKVFAGVTDGFWKDLEASGKKYMIISMQSGNYVRPTGQTGGDLNYNDVNKNFVIIDGIDYKSNSSTHKLLYMEV